MTKQQLEEISKEICALNVGVWDKADIGEGLVRLLDGLCALRIAVRLKRNANRNMFDCMCENRMHREPDFAKDYKQYIRYSTEERFADLLLAVLYLAAAKEMNFDALQPEFKRKFREFTFSNNCFAFSKLVMSVLPIKKRVIMMTGFVISWAKSEDVDLDFYVKERIKYLKLNKKED